MSLSLRSRAVLASIATLFASRLHAQAITLGDRMHAQARATVGTRGDGRGNADTVSRFVSARAPMLRFCYAERGLSRDTTLADFLFVRIRVNHAALTDSLSLRTDGSAAWLGPAGKSVSACVADKVRYWRWPPSTRDEAYEFVFGFVRDRDAQVKLPLVRG